MGLALAASASVMWWSGGAKSFSFALESSSTLESRVAALTSELNELKTETAKLRDRQDGTSDELLQLRASVGGVETGLALLRTATDQSEARSRDDADKIQSDIAVLKRATIRLRTAQEDVASELGSLRASAANAEIGLDSLRTSTGELRQQITRLDMAREATSSIGKPHKAHRVRRARRAPDSEPLPAQPVLAQWPSVLPPSRN